MPPARRPRQAPAGVVRLLEATGSSPRGWEAAVAAAVRSVREEAPAPLGVEVARLWADLDGAKLSRFHASVKGAYRQELGRARAPK